MMGTRLISTKFSVSWKAEFNTAQFANFNEYVGIGAEHADFWMRMELWDYGDVDECTEGDWVTFWHGTQSDSAFSILNNNKLRASWDESWGDKFRADPGVHFHGPGKEYGGKPKKANNYCVWMDLSNKYQTVWQVKFECRCVYNLKILKLRSKHA